MKFETLVVVADGGGARAFMEKVRHGPLTELTSWASIAPKSERNRDSGHSGTVTSRFGYGRNRVREISPAEAAERNFLVRVAERIGRAAIQGQFEKLVVIAPPKALGILRALMDPAASRRIEVSEPHDRLDDSAEELRQRLHNLRVPA
jgi:protein required for attachment to host cells